MFEFPSGCALNALVLKQTTCEKRLRRGAAVNAALKRREKKKKEDEFYNMGGNFKHTHISWQNEVKIIVTSSSRVQLQGVSNNSQTQLPRDQVCLRTMWYREISL